VSEIRQKVGDETESKPKFADILLKPKKKKKENVPPKEAPKPIASIKRAPSLIAGLTKRQVEIKTITLTENSKSKPEAPFNPTNSLTFEEFSSLVEPKVKIPQKTESDVFVYETPHKKRRNLVFSSPFNNDMD
jgi:hypothetical protein